MGQAALYSMQMEAKRPKCKSNKEKEVPSSTKGQGRWQKESSALSTDHAEAERQKQIHSPGGRQGCTTPGCRTLSTGKLENMRR